jgi:hypothetical protein
MAAVVPVARVSAGAGSAPGSTRGAGMTRGGTFAGRCAGVASARSRTADGETPGRGLVVAGDAHQVDQAHELDAADRAIGHPWQSPPSGTWADRMAAGVAEGTVMPSPPQPEPFGPNLPDVRPRAIDFLLRHPETASAFDKEYAQPGLAKKIVENTARPPAATLTARA